MRINRSAFILCCWTALVAIAAATTIAVISSPTRIAGASVWRALLTSEYTYAIAVGAGGHLQTYVALRDAPALNAAWPGRAELANGHERFLVFTSRTEQMSVADAKDEGAALLAELNHLQQSGMRGPRVTEVRSMPVEAFAALAIWTLAVFSAIGQISCVLVSLMIISGALAALKSPQPKLHTLWLGLLGVAYCTGMSAIACGHVPFV